MKVILTFLENQKGLFHHLTTHFWMLVKRSMTFGPCQETSKTAITLNPESNITRREKSHYHKFLFGLTIDGKHAWQQEEEQKGDFITALMIQE